MKKIMIYLVVCPAIALPFAAFAQSADAKYREALSVE